ncbi:eCIS core domain-containing protein [Pseudomonas syringae]|uniref:eCIS core domain-containing protein n=1 Tax=Pseudomonas syringae TaxID=317 RepID=UPI003F758B76
MSELVPPSKKSADSKAPAATQQRQSAAVLQDNRTSPVQAKAAPTPNRTGMPDPLKNGIEHLSGMNMDHVRVHFNSDKPAQLNAHAYAQGSQIHLAPGQEKHLPHEAWHVVQQAQGRVRPTMQMKGGVNINDDGGLEREADVMGGRALASRGESPNGETKGRVSRGMAVMPGSLAQRVVIESFLLNHVKLPFGNPMDTSVFNDRELKFLIDELKKIEPQDIEAKKDKAEFFDHAVSKVVEKINKAMKVGQYVKYDLVEDVEAAIVSENKLSKDALVRGFMPDDKSDPDNPKSMAQQLETCLDLSLGQPTGVLAKCLYTTYFYVPINSFLRKVEVGEVSPEITRLMKNVIKAMNAEFKRSKSIDVSLRRLELKPDWMKKTKDGGDKALPDVGDILEFSAFTSAHPDASIEGKAEENMLSDIGQGLFGKVDEIQELVILNFRGKAKILKPSVKYFKDEIEAILPPGTRARIESKEGGMRLIPIKGSPSKECPCTIYDLEIIDMQEAVG